MKELINLFLKGFGIGAANVIPGVSGGTIALITGIFERLVDSIKSFNIKAIKLLFKGKFKEFAEYTDLVFLLAVMLGAIVSVLSLAKLLVILFEKYPLFVWAYFFGLIMASVFYVGRTVEKFNFPVIISFILGTAVAVFISFLNPATENTSFLYLILCGVVAVISMILPGLSGSFVLILMGNYILVMNSIDMLDFPKLLPVAIGIIVGLLAFSHVISWIYKKYKNQTIATLTGFILGSLIILWPWKTPVFLKDDFGDNVPDSSGNLIIQSYEKYIPDAIDREVLLVFALVLSGILSVWLIEKLSTKKTEEIVEEIH